MTSTRTRQGVAPFDLERVRWKGEETFRVLSYYFSVRWNFQEAEEMVRRTLGQFVVEYDPDEYVYPRMPGMPAQYSIVRRPSPEGRFHLLVENAPITTTKPLGGAIAQLLWHINGQTVRRSGDFLIIHAGSVCTPAGEGVLLPADAGSGKTTLTTGLVRAGFGYLSDEGGCIDPASGTLYPYPRALSLKFGHRKVFPDLYRNDNGWGAGEERHLSPAEIRPAAIAGPCRVRYIIAPRYEPNASTELTPISPAEGAMVLLRHAFNLPVYRARALPVVAKIARQARSYRLVSGDLDEAVQAVTRATRSRRRLPARAG
ncbi:MAG TPA: hypothetical protein VEQ37_20010 [Actinomycetota bacterium]|nr:hypothetical protein [Actinomycetota bacterium]